VTRPGPCVEASPRRRVRVLSLHEDYACRQTGVCCSSGWDVPVEAEVEDRLRAALRDHTLRAPGGSDRCFRPTPGLPDGARVVFGHDVRGRCVFLETGRGNLCAVHRQLGPDHLASACRDFPRVVTLSPLGVSITLSHYCPTAAGLLFRDKPPPVIRRDPPAFPPSWPYEGLDAREALPPLVRPGVLMDWDSHERWEVWTVSVLAQEGRSAEECLATLSSAAEKAREWTPAAGPFGGFFEGCLATPGSPAVEPTGLSFARCLRAWREAAAAVPIRDLVPSLPEGLTEIDARWVRPAWTSLARPLRHYLAARAFASWCALQGEGLRTTVHAVRSALLVLRVEAARACAGARGPLDAERLRDAIRATDLLLVHLASPEDLARRWTAVEREPAPPSP
jgi:Fe-S-cluster containining protein